MSADLVQLVTSIAQRARAASLVLATTPAAAKNAALLRLAELLPASAEALLAANEKDLHSPEAQRLTPAQRDRLTLTPARLAHLAESVRQVAALPYPVGAVIDEWTRPNGLRIEKRRVPIGVIGIIYEARPNVTIDCAILCLKSGNACILRGGKEIFHTNTAFAALIRQALIGSEIPAEIPNPKSQIPNNGTVAAAPSSGSQPSALGSQPAPLPADAVQLIPTTDRAALNTLLKLDTLVHCIIPRGGESLIRFVAQNSTIPVIKHYTGVCFVYVDKDADPAIAEAVLVNAKTQRPGVCNAAEQLLIHADATDTLLPRLAAALIGHGVQLRCDERAATALSRAGLAHTLAKPADYTTEFLDLIIAVRVVDSLEDAIATVNRDSSGHTEAIITRDAAAARRFQEAVDSAVVTWNASTRFNDGFEFGFGAEIGISTDRLHARGPMGLNELCTYKYLVTGTGQVRE